MAVTPEVLKQWLHDGEEIALLDVREHGEYGEGHLFHAVSLPYSRLELELERLVPRRNTRLVLHDDGTSGVVHRARTRVRACGYTDVHVLAGGTRAWARAGYRLFKGVNVVSKAFGELVDHACRVPTISADDLRERRARGDKLVVVDGRPREEYQRMSIPGAICCPNGELVYRIAQIAPDPDTLIVVHCAGRTRSIIGAETLRRFGIPNPVVALANGTMGWRLAGFELEQGAGRFYPEPPGDPAALRDRAYRLAERFGVPRVGADTIARWLEDGTRSTYLFDVRTPEEFAQDPVMGAVSAPGGQLVQATDQWIGTRGARVVLLDDREIRAIPVAAWLRQMGWDVHVLRDGIAAGKGRIEPAPVRTALHSLPEPALLDTAALAELQQSATVLDLRPSRVFRAGHVIGAVWATRARLASVPVGRPLVLVADDAGIARAFAVDAMAAGHRIRGWHRGNPDAWRVAGMAVESTPDRPADAECIDFLFFVHDRHDGNLDAARRYLAWEIGLVDQLDPLERAAFRVEPLDPAVARG